MRFFFSLASSLSRSFDGRAHGEKKHRVIEMGAEKEER